MHFTHSKYYFIFFKRFHQKYPYRHLVPSIGDIAYSSTFNLEFNYKKTET